MWSFFAWLNNLWPFSADNENKTRWPCLNNIKNNVQDYFLTVIQFSIIPWSPRLHQCDRQDNVTAEMLSTVQNVIFFRLTYQSMDVLCRQQKQDAYVVHVLTTSRTICNSTFLQLYIIRYYSLKTLVPVWLTR